MYLLSGCATVNKIKNYDSCQEQVNLLKARLAETQEKQETQLEAVERELSSQLGEELAKYKAKLEMTERGLVLTFLAEVFFKSGKADILDDAKVSLKKVSTVLKKEAAGTFLAVEGHTDNVPIKYSGWKSNWELASARALSVLHFFEDECGIDPARLKSVSYGEYSPVKSNDSSVGRKQNRRVEIVILPAAIKKTRMSE